MIKVYITEFDKEKLTNEQKELIELQIKVFEDVIENSDYDENHLENEYHLLFDIDNRKGHTSMVTILKYDEEGIMYIYDAYSLGSNWYFAK